MTSEIFEEYLIEWDLRLQSEGRQIVAFVDNCPSHPKSLQSKLNSINLQFLPPNTTSVIQPMDSGVIANLKRHYRTKLVALLETAGTRDDFMSISVLEAMKLLASSWASVESETIRNCFTKAGWCYGDIIEEHLESDESYNEFDHFDDEIYTDAQFSDEQIIEMVQTMDTELEENNFDADEEETTAPKRTIEFLKDLEQRFLDENVNPEIMHLFYQLNALYQEENSAN